MSVLKNLFKNNIGSSRTGLSPEYIVVGLGNPGKQYQMTRHNVGFLFMDYVAQEYNISINKLKYKALCGDSVVFEHRVLFLKPQTYMNLSGESVAEAARYYKIPTENILVIYDDVSLDLGKIRIRRKGTDGGHNGIKSIISHLGTDVFPRIKIGVGKKPHPDYNLADWVLSAFSKEEQELLFPAIKTSNSAMQTILTQGIDPAMNLYNR